MITRWETFQQYFYKYCRVNAVSTTPFDPHGGRCSREHIRIPNTFETIIRQNADKSFENYSHSYVVEKKICFLKQDPYTIDPTWFDI